MLIKKWKLKKIIALILAAGCISAAGCSSAENNFNYSVDGYYSEYMNGNISDNINLGEITISGRSFALPFSVRELTDLGMSNTGSYNLNVNNQGYSFYGSGYGFLHLDASVLTASKSSYGSLLFVETDGDNITACGVNSRFISTDWEPEFYKGIKIGTERKVVEDLLGKGGIYEQNVYYKNQSYVMVIDYGLDENASSSDKDTIKNIIVYTIS